MENKIIIGDIYEHDFSFNQDDVIKFSNATGDINPIHLDKEYAKKTPFKTPHCTWIFSWKCFLESIWNYLSRGRNHIFKTRNGFFKTNVCKPDLQSNF